jgi:hypothetical protein
MTHKERQYMSQDKARELMREWLEKQEQIRLVQEMEKWYMREAKAEAKRVRTQNAPSAYISKHWDKALRESCWKVEYTHSDEVTYVRGGRDISYVYNMIKRIYPHITVYTQDAEYIHVI